MRELTDASATVGGPAAPMADALAGREGLRASRPAWVSRPWAHAEVWLVALVAAAPLLIANDGSLYSTATTAGCYALVVLSLQWLVGYTGMLVLGHPALFGTGAYVSAILTTRHDWPFLAAAAVGMAVAVVLAAVVAPMLRLHGVYLALGTLALVFLFGEAVFFWSDQTGGASGLVGISSLPFVEPTGAGRHLTYVVIWTFVVVAVLASRRLISTRAGRSLFALREDEDVARSVGVRAVRARLEIWLASAALSGLAGAFYAHHVRYLAPSQFGVGLSLELLAMLIVGGVSSPLGAVLGVILFLMLPEVFSGLGEYRPFLFGGSLLLVVALAPDGLVTVPSRLRGLAARWSR
jgi:branched-chain amino acid transport system permease protein